MKLALFDFDGTLTTEDGFTRFIRYAVRRPRQLRGVLLLGPAILGYRLQRVPASWLRQRIVWHGLRDEPVERIRELGQRFAEEEIPKLLRDSAMQQLRRHQQDGDPVVVVSASLDVYLQPWCETQGIELLCSRLAVNEDGLLSGRYVDGDCAGAGKVCQIRSHYQLADYQEIVAYGDTPEDEPMLALADRAFMCGQECSARNELRATCTPPKA